MEYYSPLRYPGGKAKLAPFIKQLVELYGHQNGTYIEPFAGGAGIACELLVSGTVSRVVINDLDKGIYSFWRAILTETDRFLEAIDRVPITIEEWMRQRDYYRCNANKYSFELGFAVFFLNRTNRSGIIKGGVIGGIQQTGKWKLDARFNRAALSNRIEQIAKHKDHIVLYNKDIESFLLHYLPKYEDNCFIYFDPPYFEKGKQLYLNYFTPEDHQRIASCIKSKVKSDWLITYDNTPEIRAIYLDRPLYCYEIRYSAARKRREEELIIFKDLDKIPTERTLVGTNLILKEIVYG